MGWLIGRQIYTGPSWTLILMAPNMARLPPSRRVGGMEIGFSLMVPLDSWIYPELKRLAALGYIGASLPVLSPGPPRVSPPDR